MFTATIWLALRHCAHPCMLCIIDVITETESLIHCPSVYCSAATREILLRLERFPCRINYAKGILEARIQRYKHLKALLVCLFLCLYVGKCLHKTQKPLPLETPTLLELKPGNTIQVTLFNANHCPGAVMFCTFYKGQSGLPKSVLTPAFSV
jgi:Cft2 family RNA processing exonuclease